MSFYAVRFGRIPGIYTCWESCKSQVAGFKGAIYKKFTNKEKANAFYKNTAKCYSMRSKNTIKTNNTSKKNEKQLEKQKETIYIFTDGSSVNNGSKNSKSGYGIYIPDPKSMRVKVYGKLPKGKTNNYAELRAILEALKLIESYGFHTNCKKPVTIVTDSQYSINCITKWYNKWVKNNWISATKKEVKNKELIQEIKPLCDKHNVTFQHINSHTGKSGFFYEGNKIVDELANGNTDV